MENEEETFFLCPYCWQKISMVVETQASQSYIEDCEVCCRPIQIDYTVSEGRVENVSAKALDE